MKKLLITILFCLFAFPAHAKDFTLYYFHGNVRCLTCKHFEDWTRSVAKELPVSFQVINTDEDENTHYLHDYSLYTKSVVIVDRNGKFKNLDKIWMLSRDENEFRAYIMQEVKQFMKENQ